MKRLMLVMFALSLVLTLSIAGCQTCGDGSCRTEAKKACGPDCAKPCCAEAKKACGPDCAKPCCAEATLCAKCGEVGGSDACCKLEGKKVCTQCNLIAGSPGCKAACAIS